MEKKPASEINLALSGGGLRASYFHLGTLLALATHGRLDDIRRISGVSGGAIVGALYAKRLAEYKGSLSGSDAQIQFVCDLEDALWRGVQNNLRMHAIFSFINYLKYGAFGVLKTTEAIERAYSRYFFKKDKLGELTTRLKNSGKKLELIINATDMNTQKGVQLVGHPFNECILSKLVAASTAVPGIFEPVTIKVEANVWHLSDGGVFDNQGIQSLKTTSGLLIVSDGSAGAQGDIGQQVGRLNLAMQANSILMEMHRTRQLNELALELKDAQHKFHVISIRPDTDIIPNDMLSKAL